MPCNCDENHDEQANTQACENQGTEEKCCGGKKCCGHEECCGKDCCCCGKKFVRDVLVTAAVSAAFIYIVKKLRK